MIYAVESIAVELRQLEHFLAVAQERSFTRASARVHLAQSSLSASIRTLEQDLGETLFLRSTHHVELTPAGEAFVAEAHRVLLAVQSARDTASAYRDRLRGSLRIGIMQSLAPTRILEAFGEFHGRHPGVRIELRASADGSAALAQQLLQGELDLAFLWLTSSLPPGVTETALASEELILIHRDPRPDWPRRPLTPHDLAKESFVESPTGWGTRAAVDLAFARADLQREIAIEAADSLTRIELVRAGLGIALIPSSLLQYTGKLRARPVSGFPACDTTLIVPERHPITAATRAFVEFIGETGPARLGTGA